MVRSYIICIRLEVRVGPLIAFPAFQVAAQARPPAALGQDPVSADKRRIVPHVLIVMAFERGTPRALLILIKADDLTFHLPGPTRRFAAGLHQRKIVSAISQQMPDEMISGQSWS